MAQDPMKVDQLQVEPGVAGIRLINRATDGSLQFFDAFITGGITLSRLAGLRNIGGLLVVGKTGAGAAYTTVQSALDAIPATSSPSNPYFVLIGPGVYKETLNVVRDGVTLIGFGAFLQSLAEDTPNGAGAYHTLVVQAALGTVPRKVTLINLDISNAHDAYAAIRVFGGAGSEVAQDRLLIQECNVRNTGAGRPLWATSANHLYLKGGSMRGSGTSSMVLVEECASFLAEGVDGIPAAQMDFDTAGDLPSEAGSTSTYRLSGCPGVGADSLLAPPLSSTLSGRGLLEIVGCSGGAAAVFDGDRSVRVIGSRLGDLTLNGSVAMSLDHSRKGSVTSGGTATLEEPVQRGTVAFVAEVTKAVVFATPQPNANYTVGLELGAPPANDEAWWVTAKTAAGFTLNFTSAQTLSAVWSATRTMGGAVN